MENKIATKIIELDMATRRALAKIGNRNSLSLKNRVLFLLNASPKTPQELMSELEIGKTNLALLTKTMLSENLILSQNLSFDRRLLEYSITELGKQQLETLLERIENIFKNIITTQEEYSSAYTNIDQVLQLLSFL